MHTGIIKTENTGRYQYGHWYIKRSCCQFISMSVPTLNLSVIAALYEHPDRRALPTAMQQGSGTPSLCTNHNGSLCLKTANVLWVFSALWFVRFNVTLKLQGHACLLGNFHPGRCLLRLRHVRQNLSPPPKKKKMTKVAERNSERQWRHENIESVLGGTLKALSKCTSKCPSARGLNWTRSFEILPTPRLSKTQECEIPEREKKESSSAEWEMNVKDLHLHNCSRRKLIVTCLTVQFAWSFTLKVQYLAVHSAIIWPFFHAEVQRLRFTQKMYLCITQKTFSLIKLQKGRKSSIK